MRLSPQQWTLLFIWVISFIVSLIVIGYVQIYQFAVPDPPKSIHALWEQVLALYSVFLTTMLSLAYARQTRPAPDVKLFASWGWPGFGLALGLSLAWNVGFVFCVCRFAFTPHLDVTSLSEILQQFFGSSAWVVNPFVGFYFGFEKS
jgi:hypothetical protein